MRAFQLAKWGESGMTGKSIMDFIIARASLRQ
jgi:hypothetical protein